MDKADPVMDILDRLMEPFPALLSPQRPAPPPADVRGRLLSPRVAGSRHIFLNLAPARTTRWALALAGREECTPEYLIDRESYPFHVVEYIAAGRGVVRLGNGPSETVGPGAVFAYAPTMRSWMQTDPSAPLVKFFFAVAGSEVPGRLALAKLAPGVIRRLAVPAEVLSVAEDIVREGQRHSLRAQAICLKLVELFLLKVADAVERADSAEQRARETFLRCKALIEARADSLMALGDVADELRLDPSSICRLFRRFQGATPYQYLLRRKMALAAEFLVETGGLVKEAAERVGFADPYHFARCFKKVHGVPPSTVRRYRTGVAESSSRRRGS